jgi:hypothetical protein
MYFRHQLSFDRTFHPDNKGTYSQLRDFTTKYSSTDGTWAQLVHVELETFQKYDAADLRQYLKITEISTEKQRDTQSGNKTSTESAEPNSSSSESHMDSSEPSLKSVDKDLASQKVNMKMARAARLRSTDVDLRGDLTLPPAPNGTSRIDENDNSTGESASSKSGQEKPRFKQLFSWNNKGRNGNGKTKRETCGRLKTNGRAPHTN